MPGTLIESPGSIVDEVWASTSRKSSAIVIDFNYQGLDILSSPFKQMNYYNLHTLWRKAERLVHDIKVFSMRPLMLKHDFFIMTVYISYKFDSAVKSSQITILPTVQPEMISQFGGAVLPKGPVKARVCRWTSLELGHYPIKGVMDMSSEYRFHSYISHSETTNIQEGILVDIPLHHLIMRLTKQHMLTIAAAHNVSCNTSIQKNKTRLANTILQHRCLSCSKFTTLFVPTDSAQTGAQRKQNQRQRRLLPLNETSSTVNVDAKFPPPPPNKNMLDSVIRGFSEAIKLENFIEGPCAVCGLLTSKKELKALSELKLNLDILKPDIAVTRKERKNVSDPMVPHSGPVLLPNCKDVCPTCVTELELGRLPPDSLANGLWIGEVPDALKDLSWTEKLLIARVKHNACIVKVQISGMSKMKANVVSHSLPMPKVYSVLPPPREDLDNVLAFLYLGPNQPTTKDYKRTPMLVRRKKWLQH